MTFHTPVAADTSNLWFGNTRVSIRLASAAGADGLSVVEHWMPFGDGPPLHVHHSEDEVFHILAGNVRFRIDGRPDVLADAGDTLIAPKGIPHQFRVESPGGARCLTIVRGADFETMLRAASRPATGPGLPEAAAPTPEQIALLTRLCAANGIEIVGPPLA
jgi:quercetin dioxygenase-like cupin family protein